MHVYISPCCFLLNRFWSCISLDKKHWKTFGNEKKSEIGLVAVKRKLSGMCDSGCAFVTVHCAITIKHFFAWTPFLKRYAIIRRLSDDPGSFDLLI